MEGRTKRESDIRREEKWQTCWCCRDQQRACRMAQASAEKLKPTVPAQKEKVASVPQREQLATTPERRLPKKRNRAVCPEYQLVRGERIKVSESFSLAKVRGSKREYGEERMDSTVNEGKFKGGEEGQARRIFLRESMSG